MVDNDTAERLFKARLVALIAMHFGEKTAELYKGLFSTMPLEFVEKTAEKLFTEYLGTDRAKALITETKKSDI
ncbi:MAG: hypothetical protein ACD_21C00103G0002 [uncultured bacterium]|nr:MAG: hypothetical protein ACD_21C00103G0002 [uncultured bacterium]